MKIKRLVFRYWWFIVLLLVAGYYLARNKVDDFKENQEKVFSVDRVESIHSVKLIQGDNLILVERTNDGWLINNSFYASIDAVEALLRVVSRIRATSPIPLSVKDSLIPQIESNGIEVSISSQNNVLKNYHIHYTSTMKLGSVGMLSEASNAFKLNLPRYQGDITSLIKLNPAYWKTNKLAVPSIGDIQYLEIDFPKEPEKSFRLDFSEETKPRLYDISQGAIVSNYNSQKMSSFINELSSLTYSDIATGLSKTERKIVLDSQPDTKLTFNMTKNRSYVLKIYPVPVDEYKDELGRTVKQDPDRLYVSQSNDNNIYIIKYIDAHTILRDLSYFEPIF